MFESTGEFLSKGFSWLNVFLALKYFIVFLFLVVIFIFCYVILRDLFSFLGLPFIMFPLICFVLLILFIPFEDSL